MIELGLVALFLLLLSAAISLSTKMDMHFSANIEEGYIYFVVRGKKLHKIILGISRTDSETIRENLEARNIPWSDGESSWLARRFGIHFVSLFYPLIKLHEFQLVAEGVKDGSRGKEKPGEGAPLRDWLYQETRTVKGLRWRFPRPVLVEGVELKDKFTIDTIVMELLEVVDPYPPVMTYHGNFFRVVSTMTEGAMNDMVVKDPYAPPTEKAYSYEEFVNLNKGDGSNFALTLRQKINLGVEEATSIPEEEEGLTSAIGIKCNRSFIHKFALSPKQEEIEKAVREKEKQKQIADGVREKAKGEADATRTLARGEADAKLTLADAESARVAKLIEPFQNIKADPNVTTSAVGSLLKTEALPENLTTFVEGGGAAVISVPTKGEPK